MKNFLSKIITILIFSLFIKPIQAQVVFESSNKHVYSFLERLSMRGVIELNDIVKPISRKLIAEKLAELNTKNEKLTNLEKEELQFFMKDYYFEMHGFDSSNAEKKYLSYFGGDEAERWRFFSYGDNTFKFLTDLQLGFDLFFVNKIRTLHSWMGISSYSYFMNNIGISLYYKTENEKGDNLDISRDFTPKTGIIPELHEYGRDIAYTEVRSSIAFDWGWGDIAIAKDYIEYGYEKFGNLVLSKKAPSFPYVRLDLKPVDWFSFTYFHAWLSSLVIDSLKVNAYNRDIYRNKYFAWHALTLTPITGLDVTLGESVIYADRIEPIYIMPFMFFYLSDEYISNRHNKPGDANQQIFLSLSSKNHIKNTHLYGTLFIDELTIGGLNGSLFINTTYGGATQRRQRTQLGYTLGMAVTDLPIDNLTLSFEFTRINPFVYGHHDSAQTYTNSGYLMGHWMGHNSDLVYGDLKYRILRGLEADVWGAFIRKGSSDYSGQYKQPEPSFLFGLRTNYTYLGFNLKYEMINDLNFETRIKLTKISSEQSSGEFEHEYLRELGLSIYFGF